MLSESPPLIRMGLRFIALPYCYFKLINWKQCKTSHYQVLKDILHIFFRLKYFPDNYSPCRFWEIDRKEWNYYYGSTYHPYQRHRLRKEVQPFDYQILFNDKEVCEKLCAGFDIKMPKSFGIIDKNSNYHEILRSIFNGYGVDKLIIKPVLGHAGIGIVMAFKEQDQIFIKRRGNITPLSDFVLTDRSIIQEVIVQEKRIASISSSSVNTIRVVTLLAKSNETIVISSSMRFSVGDSYVDNWSAGGVAVGVNYETGRLKSTAYDKFGNKYHQHPVSRKVFLDFQIPYWDEVLCLAMKVQNIFTFYKLLGMDIAVTRDGPVLIEINANPDIIFQEQTSGPLLKNKDVFLKFKEYNLLINSFQRGLYDDH